MQEKLLCNVDDTRKKKRPYNMIDDLRKKEGSCDKVYRSSKKKRICDNVDDVWKKEVMRFGRYLYQEKMFMRQVA